MNPAAKSGKPSTFAPADPQDNGEPYCLADFIAPGTAGGSTGWGLRRAAGSEVEEYARYFREKHDDYSAIMTQALGDRSPGPGRYLHKAVRDQ